MKGKNKCIPLKEADRVSIADGSVHIQTSSAKQPATPSWLGEVALVASHLQKQGILNTIAERMRFARRRFGRYDVLDFVAVLFGYAISGERTLEAFYEVVHPFASAFMALFGRASFPAASTLSRFLAALPAEPVEALRTLFLEDLLARCLSPEEQDAGDTVCISLSEPFFLQKGGSHNLTSEKHNRVHEPGKAALLLAATG